MTILNTFYAKTSGVEVSVKDGKIILRFFTFNNNNSRNDNLKGRFVLDPAEAFQAHLAVLATIKGGNSQKFIHKYNNNGQETVSNLTLEKWERNGKSGYAVVYRKEANPEVKINVAMNQADFLYFGELLKFASLAYTLLDKGDQERTNTNTTANANRETQVVTDIDDYLE